MGPIPPDNCGTHRAKTSPHPQNEVRNAGHRRSTPRPFSVAADEEVATTGTVTFPAAEVHVTSLLLALLDRLVSQEAARTNAAQASADLIRNRRQLKDVEAFLNQHLRDQSNGQQPETAEEPADPACANTEGADPWDLPAITHGR